MTQKELADKSALTQSIISDLENGDYNPSIEVLQKIAQALEVEYEVLNKQNVTRKMIEIVDYMTRQLEEIGTLKAMKLLYLIDFESLQKSGQKLIGLDYIRWNRGPFNKEIYDAEKIFATTKVNYKAQVFKSYLTLGKEDAKFIDMILEKYGHMESINLMRYTYTTKPME